LKIIYFESYFSIRIYRIFTLLRITQYQHLTSKKQAVIKHHCQTYLREGGFPETLSLSENLRYQTIQSYVNTAVFRDVIDRHQLSQPHIVKLFLIHCLQNIASPLSITKIYKTLKSRGETLSRSSLSKVPKNTVIHGGDVRHAIAKRF
jgi:predicted AAA+ superfamily ATPase